MSSGGGGGTPTQNATANLLFDLLRIQVPNSANVTTFRIQVLDANGVILNTPTDFPKSTSVTITIPGGVAANARTIRILFLNSSGVVLSGLQQPFTIAPGQTLNDAVTGTATVANLTTVAVSPTTANITVGGTQQFAASGTFVAGNISVTSNITSATWTSSNTAVATVSNTGLATGVAQGSTNITATVTNPAGGTTSGAATLNVAAGNTGTNTITGAAVLPAAASIANVGGTTSVGVNATVNGTLTNVTANSTFTSSNTGVATVAANGTVTAVANGTSSITAVVNIGGITANATGSTITVGSAVTGNLTIAPSAATTVVGGNVVINGTIGGASVNVTLAVGNTAVATVSGNTLTGVSVGSTNFTATANGQTANGTITVVNGQLNSLRLEPGTSANTTEGGQIQFKAFAQFTAAGVAGFVESDVTNQCAWTVTGNPTNAGDIVSYDAGAGNFTATRGDGIAPVLVTALYSTPSNAAQQSASVTIGKSSPALNIRQAGTTSTATTSRLPLGGWGALYELNATYPSGFSQVISNNGLVAWTSSVGTGTAPVGNLTTFPTGRFEVRTGNITGAGTAAANGTPSSTSLTATYNNAASNGTSPAHSVGLFTYTLTNCTAAFAPAIATDKKVIAKFGARPISLLVNFADEFNAGSNVILPVFINPAFNNNGTAGAFTMEMNLSGGVAAGTTGKAGAINGFDRLAHGTLVPFTSAISPVGYSHVLRAVTTSGFYNNDFVRLRLFARTLRPVIVTGNPADYVAVHTTAGIFDVAGATLAARNAAKTATMTGVSVDNNGTFLFNVANANLRRGQATNGTLTATYNVLGGTTEDVTLLARLTSSAAGVVSIGNFPGFGANGIGTVHGRATAVSPPGGGAITTTTLTATYPGVPNTATTTGINVTLP